MDGPGIVDGFPALSNRGGVNKIGTTDEMDWSEMGQEEVKYQLNYAEKSDRFLIDILSHYWKSSNGKLVLRITGLYGLV